MIKTAIENKQNLIVEGCYVPADWRNDFDENYLSEIKYICLAFTEEYIDNHMEDIIAHESDVEKRMFDADLTQQWLKEANRAYIESCRKNHEKLILIEDTYEIDPDKIAII